MESRRREYKDRFALRSWNIYVSVAVQPLQRLQTSICRGRAEDVYACTVFSDTLQGFDNYSIRLKNRIYRWPGLTSKYWIHDSRVKTLNLSSVSIWIKAQIRGMTCWCFGRLFICDWNPPLSRLGRYSAEGYFRSCPRTLRVTLHCCVVRCPQLTSWLPTWQIIAWICCVVYLVPRQINLRHLQQSISNWLEANWPQVTIVD